MIYLNKCYYHAKLISYELKLTIDNHQRFWSNWCNILRKFSINAQNSRCQGFNSLNVPNERRPKLGTKVK